MATNNAPKHDFAPAWLKIPTNENTKPPSSRQGKRNPAGGSNKSRHHSVDDDYYAYNYGAYAYYNGYGYGEKFGGHYGSQPSLVRPPGQRDKYQHPHARYGGGQGMGYPYYDFLPPYEYYGNDPYYNNYQSGRGGSRKSYNDKDSRVNGKDGKDREERNGKDEDSDKPFIDDFPSLNGGVDKTTGTTKGSKQMNGSSGVWDKPRKSGTNKTVTETTETDSSQTKVLRDSNILKNLVPTKSTIPRRPARMNGSMTKEPGPLWGLKPTISVSSSPPGNNKEINGPPSTPPMDILNTRFVTQPKTLSDKKSNFLKALKQEDEKGLDRSYGHKVDGLTNGIDSLNINEDANHLSSSLEAEQRLLREMGWNEADDEEYEITEDDKKQFQNIARNINHQQQRNGLKSIPKTWSPKHIPVYQPDANELNETLSSSDSDSDDCGN